MAIRKEDKPAKRDPELRRNVADVVRPYDYARARPEDERQKIATSLDSQFMAELEKLADENGQSKAALARTALEEYISASSSVTRVDNKSGPIRDVSQALFYCRAIIASFEEAIEYDPKRHHNQPPPALRIENPDFLAEVRKLVVELRALNANLATVNQSSARRNSARRPVQKSTVDVAKHLNTFLNKYAAALGTGAATLTLGAVGSLIFNLGGDAGIFEHLLHKFPMLK